jgi:DNA-3-methyladenine glycosylase I
MLQRCTWAKSSQLERDYHDNEWGVPLHNDRLLFEFLILEGAQAGLSWSTVLNKREGYRNAFDNFCAEKIVLYKANKITELLANPNIIRNRLKINSAISNAKAFLQIQQQFGSFDHYIWQFIGHQTRHNHWKSQGELPANTAESDAMSKSLKQFGFKFVGSTICYAFMQATGMVNDHTTDCDRYQQLIQQDK